MVLIYLVSGLNWTVLWTHGIHVHPRRGTILICHWKQGTVLYSITLTWVAQRARDSTLRCPVCSLECCGRERQRSQFSVSYAPARANCSSLHSRKHDCFFLLQPCYWNCTLASSHSLVIFYNIFPEICFSSPKSVLNLAVESCNKEDPNTHPRFTSNSDTFLSLSSATRK